MKWYDQLSHARRCLSLFVSLVSTMCNHKSYTKVKELAQRNCSVNSDGTFFPFFCILSQLIF